MPLNCVGDAAGAGAEGAAASGNLTMWLFPILLIVVFVVLIIVPNKRKEKQFKNMLGTLRVGDHIKTIGGFYGRVISIKEDLITFECGPDKSKLVIAKGAIASIESADDGKEIPEKATEKKEDKEDTKDKKESSEKDTSKKKK